MLVNCCTSYITVRDQRPVVDKCFNVCSSVVVFFCSSPCLHFKISLMNITIGPTSIGSTRNSSLASFDRSNAISTFPTEELCSPSETNTSNESCSGLRPDELLDLMYCTKPSSSSDIVNVVAGRPTPGWRPLLRPEYVTVRNYCTNYGHIISYSIYRAENLNDQWRRSVVK